jgi:arginine/ornithine N-succinyltransferase beta subunit
VSQVADDLRAAADVLERDGWTQRNYVDRGGCRCMIGALAAATREDLRTWNTVRVDAGRKAMRDFLHQNLASWNDAEGRTAAEVTAALREAANTAEATG